MELAELGGLKALTIRAVADKVGVAHRSLYNHFADRDALVDAVAEQAFELQAEVLRGARSRTEFVRHYVRFALDHPHLFEVMASRPHATMKHRPGLRRAVHLTIADAMRLFGRPDRSSAENRTAVMKVFVLLYGGITSYRAGILDVDGDEGIISELQAMVASE